MIRVLEAVVAEAKRLHCLALHWKPRDRDSFGARCRSCGRYWG